MFHKKISSLALATFLLGSTAAVTTTSVSAQVIGQCTNVTVSEILTGPVFSGLVRFSDSGCGTSGLVCIAPENDITPAVSNKLFATALTAQATGSSFSIVRYDTGLLGCDGGNGGFPMATDIRISAQ